MEPIGQRRLDLLFAVQTFYMYQFAGGKSSDVTLESFLPSWWSEDLDKDDSTEQSREAMMAKFSKAFSNFGGGGASGS